MKLLIVFLMLYQNCLAGEPASEVSVDGVGGLLLFFYIVTLVLWNPKASILNVGKAFLLFFLYAFLFTLAFVPVETPKCSREESLEESLEESMEVALRKWEVEIIAKKLYLPQNKVYLIPKNSSSSSLGKKLSIPFPSSLGDYYLLSKDEFKKGLLTITYIHEGRSGRSYTRGKIDCITMEFKNIAYGVGTSEESMRLNESQWYPLVWGSAKYCIARELCKGSY